MPNSSGFMDHWVNIDSERLDRYETMYEWNPASAVFYEPAQLGEDHIVADFGCGPGHAAIEFAHRVGSGGHVHAMDVNAEFVARARTRALDAGLDDRITAHLLEDTRLPLPDQSLDRVIARNTIIYVPDPVFTFSEFRRALRPGGIAHAIEGDWTLTVVEPLGQQWRDIVDAASWAWPRPQIGRELYGHARGAGFTDVSLRVMTVPDMDGRLLGMIRTVSGYAKESGKISPEKLDAMLETVEAALAEGTYLAISPQFLATATA